MSYTVGQLHKYSIDLYKRLPAETGQDVSFHVTGNLRLATSRDRMDEYQKYCGTANTIGVPFEIIGPKQVKELWPLLDARRQRRTRRRSSAGSITRTTATLRRRTSRWRCARVPAAKAPRSTSKPRSRRSRARARGEWQLTTTQGEIVAEHVVCATGNYARQTGKMFGLNVPAIPVEHQYIVYDESKELKAYRQGGGRELAVMREPDQSYYLREERMGWILGPYEAGAPARFADGVPDWFGKSLFDGDLERLIPHIEGAQRRVPALANCGIKDVVNGPISYTPDGSRADRPGLGPAERLAQRGPQLRHHRRGRRRLAARGVDRRGRARHRHAGASTRAASAPTPSKRYLVQKNEETYRNVFTIHYPDEERARCAAREDEPGLRQAEAHGRRVRPALRLGARQLVRADGRRARRTHGASAARN